MIPSLSAALAERGYDTLTPVQDAVTDPALEGKDLLVSAQTGSGKTVGFGLAIAPTLLGEAESFGPAGTPLALVVAPTRELAFQVMQELRWLYAKTGAIVSSCVGGMDPRQERRTLERGTHIVVGTPGRLSDHIRRGALDLSDIRAVVLDEADEMLDLGFREDLEFILGSATEERRTLLFSATVSPMIAKLAEQFQNDAQRISTINTAQQHSDIAYKALKVAASDSDHAIFNLLRFHHDESAIVFANTRAAVNHLSARLGNRGLSVVTLSGELSQAERSHALQAMRDGRARVCVATDVAARGIDLPNLSLVIHADLPQNTESLLHRSGRTGRAGRKGMSALIVPPRMVKRAERLLKFAKINAEWSVPPSAESIIARDEERLLTDPDWREPVSEDQAAFARKLLDRHGAEAVAAAFLRLQQSRNAPPEDLLPPDTKGQSERQEFGPSRWFTLSVGRNDRAEPRWLLPLLRRHADLDKSSIGAIRVRDDETFVEIAEKSVAKFAASLGPDGELSDEIKARALNGEPDFGPPPKKRRADKPHGKPDRGDRGERPAKAPHRKGSPKAPRDDAPEESAKTSGWSPDDEAVFAALADIPPKKRKPKPEGGAAPKAKKPRAKYAGPGKGPHPGKGGKPKPGGPKKPRK
ncbi:MULTISPECIES: DEAD/DEAH box helicase [Thioclava]|uniref:DEAD/DEAH box helicase n=1 Tax=Thioclava TaxID=285107 RepID=UPI000C6114F9|nr:MULTISPECIES: DEAD/DEAH box helicase [Thioclava]MAQ35682.1 ATP-dependent RNA helicase [Thioclava sp.]|tara:strand:- start:326 stop:2248 length:1923 start_codon:yes stop_codon:yes gene_type:complete